MNLQKKECPPQSIEKPLRAKNSGQIGWTAGIFFVLSLGIALCAILQVERYRATALYLEDALAASNLASAVIDVQEYGISHKILIDDPEKAYERYRLAVMGNLNLSASWEGQKGGLVQGPVSIVRYMVYNVEPDRVTVSSFDEAGRMTQWKETPGTVMAPNGVRVTNTAVYSEIAYEVKALFGVVVTAHKANLADIAR